MAPHDPKKHSTRRRLLLLVLLGVFVLLGVGGWLASRPEPIQPGMTREQVEAVLGPPDGRMLAVGGTPTQNVTLVWKDRGVVVEFDDDNRVREVARRPSWLDSLRGDNLRGRLGF